MPMTATAMSAGWDAALAAGWAVVSMKNDWRVVFPPP